MAQGDWDDIEVMLESKMYDSFKYEGVLGSIVQNISLDSPWF